MTDTVKRRFLFSKYWWLHIGAWAIAGYFLGGYLADRYPDGLPQVDLSHAVAAGVAVLYLLMAAIVLLGSLSPKIGLAMNMADDGEDWREMRGLSINSALGCLFIGLFLMCLLAADPKGAIAAPVAAALAGACFLASAWFTWRIWVSMDELWRRVSNDATVFGFYLVFVPGMVWAGAAHLGLAAPLGPLGWISLLLMAPLVASVVANGRRGLIRT